MSGFDNGLLSEFVENADVSLWLVYYKQQIEEGHKREIRLQARNTERSKSVVSISFVFISFTFASGSVWKSFVMKTIGATSNQYEKENYKKWKRYCKQMESQFTQNNVNHMVQFSNLVKIAYADTYFKSDSNANKFWDAEIDSHSGKQYIWNEFKVFLKSDIERAITLQQNFLKKYRKHKQSHSQSIKNYNVERVSMFAELKFEFKFTKAVKLNDFRDELRLKLRCMLFKEKKIFTKTKLLERLKRMKDVQILEKELKSFKKRKISFDTDSFESENEKLKIAKSKGKKIKDTNKVNPNHESVKSKNTRMYRWFASEFKKIQNKNNCIDCDKPDHQIGICTNKKNKIISADQVLEQSKN